MVQETEKALPVGDASVTRGSGIKTGVPKPSGLQPEMILDISRRDPSREGHTSAAVSEDPRVPEPLTVLLRRASLSEEHHTLIATVVKRILSMKSGLNNAFTSLLRGFEVCDVVLPIE